MKNQLLACLLALSCLCLPARQAAAQNVIDMVCFETTLGEFCVRLFADEAPQTVANFLKYVNDGDYNNSMIHRSVSNFVIQGGGYRFTDGIGPGEVPKDAAIPNEFSRSNLTGTIAMAKMEGDPNSATSEWFINLADNTGLDTNNGGFTVFGEVVMGWSVVQNIARQPVFNLANVLGGPFGEVPLLNYDNQFVASDFVQITRVFQTQRDPSAPSPSDPFPNLVTTVNYTNTAFQAPVQWTDGRLYRMFFLQSGTPPTYIFTVDTRLISLAAERGQSRARFDGEYLTVPSAKIPGAVLTNIRFRLTNPRTLEFTLESFDRYTGEGALPE